MGYSLQMLRELLAAHPERASRLKPHIEALELSIQSQPAFCLQSVRTLFEAAHATIAPRLNIEFSKKDGFPTRMRRVIEALDFSITDHPDADAINEHISALLRSVDDMAVALANLSNVPNMRHGGSLDWGTLERQHAAMLGGVCDSLVSFLFDVAWSRPDDQAELGDEESFEDFTDFNDWLDEANGDLVVSGARFRPSQVLYLLDVTRYEAARVEWGAQEDLDAEVEEEAT